MSFVDFVVLPPGHGRSVTDFWGWDANEAQLRCPDGVWVVIQGDVVPGGALNLNYTNLPRPCSPRDSSPSRKIPTVEPGIEPGTSWLVVRDSDHYTTRLVTQINIYKCKKSVANSWHIFNCKKLFKPQIRPPSLILLITTSQDRWIFPSQSCEVRNWEITISTYTKYVRYQ